MTGREESHIEAGIFRLWIWQCYLEQRSYAEVATISKKDRDLSMKRKAAWFMNEAKQFSYCQELVGKI